MTERMPMMTKGRYEIKSTNVKKGEEHLYHLYFESKFIGAMSSLEITNHLQLNANLDTDMVIYNDKDIWPTVRGYLGEDADLEKQRVQEKEAAHVEDDEVLIERW